jgi:outer membrane protein TolC
MIRTKFFMIVFTFIFVATAFSRVFADDQAVKPLNYEDCYKIAISNSDAVKIQDENLKQANMAKMSAIGGFLPSISVEHLRDFGVSSFGSGGYSDEGWESEIVATQPVFHGLEKINELSVYDREAYKQELNLISAKRTLAENTANAFYTLASVQADVINLQDALSFMQARVKELKQWQELGKSRVSEVYATESNAALIATQLEQSKAQVDDASDALARVLGVEYQVAVIQPSESADASADINVTFTAENRSDVLAQKAELEASDKRIASGLGVLLPQVDLSAAKVLGGTPFLGSTAYKDAGWQFMLTAQYPLFQGGQRVFDTIAAFSQREAAYRQYISTLLDVKYELRSRVRDFAAAGKIVAAMKDAYAKTTQSLNAQVADYKYGLVTNVDVLQAMSDSASVKQSLDRTIISRELDKKLLEISVEVIK